MHPNKDYNILLNKLIDGTITDHERWSLDRASLDDPFLADALEGIYDNEANRKPNLVLKEPSEPRQISWYKPFLVAASVVLLLGFSFLIINNIETDNQNLLADTGESTSQKENKQTSSDTPSNIYDEEVTIEEKESAPSQTLKTESVKKQIQRPSKKSKPNGMSQESNKSASDQNEENVSPIMTGIEAEKEDVARQEYDDTKQNDEPMAMAEAMPSGQKRNNTRSKVAVIDGIPVRKPNIVSGHVYDEAGLPIRDAVVKNESDTDSSLTDASGFFALELDDQDRNVLVESRGFTPQAQSVKPELSITLKKSQNQLSQRPMLLVETMDAGQLEIEYRKILDDGLVQPFSICPQERSAPRRIMMRIYISEEGRLSSLNYMTNLSDNCQRLIEDRIIQMSLEGAFKGKVAVVFSYSLRL
jgi:cytoskeletal protein RodZ